MHVQKFHGIKNWATITGGENGESEDEFLGKSDSDDMFILNPLTTTLKVKKDYREKKNQMQTAWVHKQNLHFWHKMRNVSLPEQK